MACRAALLAVLPSTGSALAVHKAVQRDVGLHEDSAGSLDLEKMLMPAESDCQVAQAGSDCHKAVEYLRSQGFKAHPTWYPGYTSETSFEEVQDMLHGLEKAECPKPCAAQFSTSRNKAAGPVKFDCRDTVEGDLCYISVAWLKEVGFELHPDWYPGVDKDSSVASIQAQLHRNGKSDCSQPCAPTEAAQEKAKAHMEMASQAQSAQAQEVQDDDCLDATIGTQCYADVSYGLAEGVRNHPQFYEGLTEHSNFKHVQEFLYLNNRSLCERPCPIQKMSLDMMVNHYEDMREKKRVQDMSTDELSRYLNGDWDGYVAKVFRSQNDHSSTFEKRKYNPTTTTPLAEAEATMPEMSASDTTHEETSKVTVEETSKVTVEETSNVTAEETSKVTVEETSNVTAEETSKVTVEETSNVTAEDAAAHLPQLADYVEEETSQEEISQEETVQQTEAQPKEETVTEAQPEEETVQQTSKEEAARLAKEAAAAAEAAADAVEQPFPEQDATLMRGTNAARELLVCLLKLRDVTAETFGDIKAACEEKLPFEGNERVALAKESMRFFLWAQRHVQFLKDHPQEAAKVEEAAKAEEAKAEEAKEEHQAKDQAVVDEPMPEIPEEEPAQTPAEAQEEKPAEMEQELRKQIMEELKAQTTTVAPHKETEEEMRERIQAEVMRDLVAIH